MSDAIMSVVRDFEMCSKCISNNQFAANFEHRVIDNREKNVPVPVCYNAYIDALDASYEGWLLFFHEDFELREDVAGMLSGFKFDYTPSDKARKVQEYWDFEQIKPFNPKVNRITYHNPVPQIDRLYSWAYCDRTPMQKLEYERWSSIEHPKIHGVGRGDVEKGFEGIKEAVSAAAKEAVREYWRTQIRNKPKEIQGTGPEISRRGYFAPHEDQTADSRTPDIIMSQRYKVPELVYIIMARWIAR